MALNPMMAVTPDGVNYNAIIYKTLPPAESAYQMEHIHDSRANDLLVSTIIFLALATIATSLRFASRRMVRAGCGVDDWVMLGALVRISQGLS